MKLRIPLLGFIMAGCPIASAIGAELPRPRLVVQITFDQLRGDLLERYRPALTGGFKRVLDHGYWVQKGEAAHGLTVSFPGHATLATGLYPAHHGFTANEWWQQVDGQWQSVSVARDPATQIVGRDKAVGESPRQLRAASIGDWFKAASPASKVIAIGSDAVIPYAGQKPDGAYWFDGGAGGFTTSTYYGRSRPTWIEAINQRISTLPRTWELAVPRRWQSLADHPQQCPPMQPDPHFPHRYDPATGNYVSWVGSTPLADEVLFREAETIVKANGLGSDDVPDYLNIVAGTTDSVGHEYSPISLEQLDTITRLDRALGEFLDELDRTVGKDRYVIGISADHGATDPPEDRCLHRVTAAEIDGLLDRVEVIARSHTGTDKDVQDKIIAELERAPFIGDVYTEERLSSAPESDWKAQLMKRSFLPGRIPDLPLWSDKPRPFHPARYGIFVQFKEGVIFHYARSVHGSPYPDDRLVPVIFYGAGVPHRVVKTGARTADVAPTLAALAFIPTPRSLDGRPLLSSGAKP